MRACRRRMRARASRQQVYGTHSELALVKCAGGARRQSGLGGGAARGPPRPTVIKQAAARRQQRLRARTRAALREAGASARGEGRRRLARMGVARRAGAQKRGQQAEQKQTNNKYGTPGPSSPWGMGKEATAQTRLPTNQHGRQSAPTARIFSNTANAHTFGTARSIHETRSGWAPGGPGGGASTGARRPAPLSGASAASQPRTCFVS